MPPPRKSQAKRKGKGKGKSGGSSWSRNPIVGGIAALVIGICLYSLSGGGSSTKRPKLDFACANQECGFTGRKEMPPGTHLPATCEKCGKQTLYSSMKCGECGKVTPLLPSWHDFICTSCNHRDKKIRLDPYQGPQECPKCHAKTFVETYQCFKCKNIFGVDFLQQQKEMMEGGKGEGGFPMMMPGPYEIARCPKCNQIEARPASPSSRQTCMFCDSPNLRSVTPPEVLKKEMGHKLKESEQKVVDEWEKNNKGG